MTRPQSPDLSRRDFLKSSLATAGVLASAAPLAANTGTAPQPSGGMRLGTGFPAGFAWGAATSSYQIEGAVAEDGRTPSIWDTFSRTPGKTLNGDTGDVACDHYHRFREDVELMADLGVKHYRFSISWSRVLPGGRGQVNEKGLDFYKRLLDALQEKGIQPCVTLFHWDLPQVLQDEYRGWESRRITEDFAHYAETMGRRLGDRVPRWYTVNEISSFVVLAYGVGQPGFHAPGVSLGSFAELARVGHHALLAHGLGVQALRATTPKGTQIGLAENFRGYIPVVETAEHIEAADKAFAAELPNAAILRPILTGTYGEFEGAPSPSEADLKIISTPIDLLGLNCYTGDYVRAADNAKGYEVVPFADGYPRMVLNWLTLTPDAPYWAIRQATKMAGRPLSILVSENGCPDASAPNSDGSVVDTERIMYLRAYLRSVERAAVEGYPVHGYYPWSLMDNFEWGEGYNQRFGLVRVDYPTQKRTPKMSYRWFQEVIRTGRVV